MCANIICGEIQKLTNDSLVEIIFKSLKNGGTKIALVDAVTSKSKTYNDILQESISLSQNLTKMGLKENDTIAIISENSLCFPTIVFAAFYVGVIINPINNFYKERELLHILNISKPKFILCSQSALETTLIVAKQINFVEKIILIDECETLPELVINLHSLLNLPIPDNFQLMPLKRENAAILCSSGTTGMPKGVLITHAGLHSSAYTFACSYLQNYSVAFNSTNVYYERKGILNSVYFNNINFRHPNFGAVSSNIIQIGILPFFHSFGFHVCLNAVINNSKLIIMKKFDGNVFLKAIQEYKVTSMCLVPQIVTFLNSSPLVDKYDLSSFKDVIFGGASLDKDIQESVMKRLNIQVRQGYGSTETNVIAILTPRDSFKTKTIGIVLPGFEVKVFDTETGRALGCNESGEICVRGTQIMRCYVDNQIATDEAIDKEGWFHTGDLGYYNEEKYFFVIGRIKEIIKFKGFQVPPVEIENLLLAHPEVADCAVVGQPDEKVGELPTAFIVRKPNSNILETDIINFVEKNISYHKRLHGGVVFIDLIPKTTLGKIIRKELRDKLETLKPKF